MHGVLGTYLTSGRQVCTVYALLKLRLRRSNDLPYSNDTVLLPIAYEMHTNTPWIVSLLDPRTYGLRMLVEES